MSLDKTTDQTGRGTRNALLNMYILRAYLGEVFSSCAAAGCTVYVLTGNSFRRFLRSPAPFRQPGGGVASCTNDSEWCLCGADTLALCAINCCAAAAAAAAARCPPPALDTVLRSLLEPRHLSVSLDEPELALESRPRADGGFSGSLPPPTTTTTVAAAAGSLSLRNLERDYRFRINEPVKLIGGDQNQGYVHV